MESYDDNKGSVSLNDAMYRRLKNRERQRRYRERKRLQTDSNNTCFTNPSSDPSQLQIIPMPVEIIPTMPMEIIPIPMDEVTDQIVTRVHCQRDWKKDARRVHAAKQEATSTALTSNGQCFAGENHMTLSPYGTKEAVQNLKNEISTANSARVDSSDKLRFKAGKRAWKAEARNKK